MAITAPGSHRRRSALVRRRAGADDVAEEVIVLLQDEAAKGIAGLFMENASVRLLHLQHPVQVPENLLKSIRQISMLLGDAETKIAKALRESIESAR